MEQWTHKKGPQNSKNQMIIYGINCPKIVHIMRLSERPDFGADDKHLWKRSQQFVYLFLKELSTSIGQTGNGVNLSMLIFVLSSSSN